jgi:hypothetical protein
MYFSSPTRIVSQFGQDHHTAQRMYLSEQNHSLAEYFWHQHEKFRSHIVLSSCNKTLQLKLSDEAIR